MFSHNKMIEEIFLISMIKFFVEKGTKKNMINFIVKCKIQLFYLYQLNYKILKLAQQFLRIFQRKINNEHGFYDKHSRRLQSIEKTRCSTFHKYIKLSLFLSSSFWIIQDKSFFKCFKRNPIVSSSQHLIFSFIIIALRLIF